MRGRKPIPSHKLKLSSYKTVERRQKEPEPRRGVPEKPKWLSPKASVHWDRLVDLMGETVGWLRVTEGDVLASYCQSYADFVECRTLVEEEGWTAEGSHGNRIINPTVRIMHAHQDRMMKGITALGLSPSDRARVEVDDKLLNGEPDDPLMEATG